MVYLYPLLYVCTPGTRTVGRTAAAWQEIPLGGMLFRIMGTSGMRQNRAGTAQNRAATLYPPIVTTAPAACTRALGYGTDLAFSVRECGFPRK